jgi:hypothetical protein
MKKAVAKTKKIGGSLMVRIPKDIADLLSIGPDELVEIQIEKVRKSGFGIAPGMGPYRHERVGDFE